MRHYSVSYIFLLLVRYSTEECDLSGTEFSCDGDDPKTVIYGYNSKNTESVGITSIEIVNSSSSIVDDFLGSLDDDTKRGIKRISINKCDIDKIENDIFSEFQALEKLDLSDNRINDLEFLKALPESTKEIHLRNNEVTELTDVFSDIEGLQLIDLSHCHIENLDFTVFKNNLNLSLVNVSHNNIQSSISKEYLKNIRCVDMSYNSLAEYNDIPSYCLDLSYTNMTGYRWYNISGKNKTVFIEKFLYSGNSRLRLSATNVKNETLPVEIKYLNISSFGGSVSDLDLNKVKVRKELIMKDSSIPSLEKTVYDFKVLFFDEGTNATFDLSNCSITDISPFYFERYSLGRLNLCHNQFKILRNDVFKDAYLIQLDLCNSSIEKIEDHAFEGLNSISLNLSRNYIDNISFVRDLRDVRILDLSHNRISVIFSEDFSYLKQLRVLDLSHNFISTIQAGSFNSGSIEIINLSNNKLVEIKTMTFDDIPKLEKVILGGNPLVTIEGNAFRLLPNIQIIDLSQMRIAYIQPFAFNNLQNLREVHLTDNNISQLPGNIFVGVPNFRKIYLEGNCLGSFDTLNGLRIAEMRVKICDNFQFESFSNPYLRQLYIIDSNLDKFQPTGLYNLSELRFVTSTIISPQPTLLAGLFNVKYIDSRELFRNVKVLPQYVFRDMRSLNKLDLSGLVIEVIEPEAFVGLTSLENLLLGNNHIVELRDHSFSGLNTLRRLDLGNNHLSVVAVNCFSGVNEIEALLLNNNNLAIIPLGTFKNMPALIHLNLRYNKIYSLDTGLFSNLANLRVLELSYNRINNFCSEVFFPMPNLETINLEGNNLVHLSGSDLVLYNSQLKFIRLGGNKWHCGSLKDVLFHLRKANVTVIAANGCFDNHNIDGIVCESRCS